MRSAEPRQFFQHGQFLGRSAGDVSAEGFVLGKRVPTVPEAEVRTHTHAEAHYVLLLEGRYITAAAGRSSRCAQPILIYNPPGTTHRDRFVGDGGLFLSISVPATVLEGFDRAASLPTHAVQFEGGALALALRLSRAYDRGAEAPALVLDSLCAALLHATADVEDDAERQRPAWLRRVRELLHDECDRELRLQQLAAAAEVHPVYLVRAFRQSFHCTPGDYLRRCRLTRAAALLADAERPLADVANEAGFFDQAHLARRFKGAYGVTPSRYREHLGGRRFTAYKTA